MQSMGFGNMPGMFGDMGFGQDPMMQPPGGHGMSMLPHGFMSPMSMMMDPFQHMQQAMSMANDGHNNSGFSYCSSSVVSYTTDEHGRQQVYQSSNEVKQGPGGVKETKSSVRDSRTGHQELAIGHHLYDKGLVKKKSKNAYTGEVEQCEDFIGIDETEADAFERNWMNQARTMSASAHGHQIAHGNSRNNRLALTSSAHDESSSRAHRHYNGTPTMQYNGKPVMKTKKKKSKEAKDR